MAEPEGQILVPCESKSTIHSEVFLLQVEPLAVVD